MAWSRDDDELQQRGALSRRQKRVGFATRRTVGRSPKGYVWGGRALDRAVRSLYENAVDSAGCNHYMDRWQSPGSPASGHFHTTHWTEVLAAGAEASPQASDALARLCQTYWLPIYTFVRKRGHPPHQAQDLTQGFFEGFLEKGRVAQALRERGRFRSFLVASLENYLRNAHERAQAAKRGGGSKIVSLDEERDESLYLASSSEIADPVQAFEQRWASTLLGEVMDRLKAEFVERGRMDVFEPLQSHIWGDPDSVPYPELAERLGTTVSNIKILAHRMRARCRAILREEIGRTVSDPSQIDDEIRHLMRVVSQ